MLTKEDLILIHRLMTSEKVTYVGAEIPSLVVILQRLEAQIRSFDNKETPSGDVP